MRTLRVVMSVDASVEVKKWSCRLVSAACAAACRHPFGPLLGGRS